MPFRQDFSPGSAPAGTFLPCLCRILRVWKIRVKGRCPLRVQGRARNLLPRQRSAPTGAIYSPISKSQTCAPLPSGNQTPPGVTHPSKQNAVCALPRSGQRGYAAQLFHPEHAPAARRSAPTAPRAPPVKNHARPSVIRPWFFARQIPAPPVPSCKKDFTTFLFQRLDSPFFAVIQYI